MSAADEGSLSSISDNLALTQQITDLIIVIFIHGFKGTDETFGGFPERLQHVLSETISHAAVECIVFPAYETKGNLTEAVIRFADWLTTLTVEKEVASGGGAGRAKIVLCGHSMGGLLAADALLEFIKTRPDQTAPLWPKIIACLAFDTPYYGLHPFVFKNSATKAAEYAGAARTAVTGIMGTLSQFGTKSAAPDKRPIAAIAAPAGNETSQSGWSKWVPAAYAVGGAVLAGAAAGTAYYKREDIGMGYTWAADHMKYVGNLWNDVELKARVDALLDAEEHMGIVFRTFYTLLPPSPPAHRSDRTFVVLPPKSARSYSRFLPARNSIAPDEIQAHIAMFGGKTNDGYYELGLATANHIREAVMLGRGIIEDDAEKARHSEATVDSMNEHPDDTENKVVDDLMEL